MNLKKKVYEALSYYDIYQKVDVTTAIIKLAKVLKVSNNKVLEIVKQLKEENKISVKGKFFVQVEPNIIGEFHSTKSSYGFVSIKGYDKDIFVAEPKTAKEGDKVEVLLTTNNGKVEATILNIVEKQHKYLIGTVIQKDNYYFFKCDDPNVPICVILQNEDAKMAVGKKCSIKFTYEDINNSSSAFGVIDKIFGFKEDPIVENRAIAYEYGFTKEFPKEVMDEIANIPQEVTESEIVGRLDLRNLHFIATDPTGCKDKDDAIYAEKLSNNNYRCYVAIADVEHYVKKGSAIDREAYKRGTSCYLGDGVYPMLPPELSNGICSLNEGVDRLSQVAIFDLDSNGNFIKSSFKIEKCVVNIYKSMNYEDFEEVRFNRNNKEIDFKDIKDQVDLQYKISDLLSAKMHKEGAIYFKNNEPSFAFNKEKTDVVDVLDKSDITSHKVVENFMVVANEVIGTFMSTNNVPALYRVHGNPTKEKVEQVNTILKCMGINYILEPNSISYQKFTEYLKSSPYEDFLSGLTLRSLDKARYQPENIGHMGLARKMYIHYTSPIRRYPDLSCHRTLNNYIKNNKITYSNKQLEEMGEHLSEQERQATSAEVKSDKLLSAMWARNHIGEIMEGTITSFSSGAVYINCGCVSLCIPVFELQKGNNSDYRVKSNKFEMEDKISKNKYTLGENQKFKIYDVDMDTKEIYATFNLEKIIEKDEEQSENHNFQGESKE